MRVATLLTFYLQSFSVFATAHSCGLRPVFSYSALVANTLPQRIRAGCDVHPCMPKIRRSSLPQRIRAGCDKSGVCRRVAVYLCHSAFVRVATDRSIRTDNHRPLPQRIRAGCDSAAVGAALFTGFFATAHSCGLRRACCRTAVPILALPQRIRAGCDGFTAMQETDEVPLPQRIRAGCDRLFRPPRNFPALCHSAFVRVATARLAGLPDDADLCHSAFVRVATKLKVN